MIDLPRLIACGIGPSTARVFAPFLDQACRRFAITTTFHQAAFIAEAMHESTNLTHLEESLYYSKPANITNAFKRLRTLPASEVQRLVANPHALAVAAYSNVNGNGGPQTTDGWDFRGGGPFQLTGRGNYRACGMDLALPLELDPQRIRVPSIEAALSAAWFYATKGCLAMDDIDDISERINGGTTGLNERRALFQVCLPALA